MTEDPVLIAHDARGVATVTLNRPAVRNAMDDAVIASLGDAFKRLDADPAVRIVVLAGRGPAFSAGADLNYMRRMGSYGEAENVADALAISGMLRALNELGKPTVARVHGAAYAAGIGLVSACDIVVAAEEAVFSISEVRIGLVPSTIMPYVLAAIGAQAARRYCLTGEPISATEAHRLGLVHAVVPTAALDHTVEAVIAALLAGGPNSQARAKRLIADLAGRPVDDAVMELTARSIAAARASAEGREGIAAFLGKRKPSWSG
jgi:methylglutaconyl-CoA hydratase